VLLMRAGLGGPERLNSMAMNPLLQHVSGADVGDAKRRLPLTKHQAESPRLQRLARDDARSAISSEARDALEAALRRNIEGEVRFDAGSRALYATDGSNYRQAPIGVVLPRSTQDVESTVRLAREHGAPILSRGGGTSLAGQCCNVAILIDFSKYMHRVLSIDSEVRLGRAEPGCVLDRFRETARSRGGLWFGPDPATHDRCTLGGMLGNNSCGSHSLLSKNNGLGLRTSDNTHTLDVLLYDGTRMRVGPTTPEERSAIINAGGRRGEVYAELERLVHRHENAIRDQYPRLGRRVSGYNLDELLPERGFNVARALVGSESTLVTILEAELHLIPAPVARTVVMLGFDDICTGAECALDVLEFSPSACEGIDSLLFEYVRRKGDQEASLAILPRGSAFVLAEFAGGSREESDALAKRMMAHVSTLGRRAPVDMRLYDGPEQAEMIWSVREGGLGSTAWVPGLPDNWPGWEDSAVPVENVAEYLHELRALFNEYGYNPALYGHFGQGCVHCRVPFDFYTQAGIDKYRHFMDAAVDLVVRLGGVASGEHGDGQARAEFLPRIFGPELTQAFVEFKRIWDPTNRLNPGKVMDVGGSSYSITDNLRIGADYDPPRVQTHFDFPGDDGSFARAALRCVGVGTCRRESGGTMCPSYMVTREEMHSTRGRARLLFEMLNGELIREGWKSEAVRDALDLCLSCKGCKGDCPVNVDMATYKAEFLSHYYEGRLRPRHAYAFGWIHGWARLASLAPSLANLVSRMPGSSGLVKRLAGVHPERQIPPFAPRRFKHWFFSQDVLNPDGPRVVLFPDTFSDFFQPDVAIAATQVLQDAGFRVEVPRGDVCCGRPLYDYGFLGLAQQRWIRTLDVLQPYCEAGVPMVVLEPSCWAAFKDELTNLMPDHPGARRVQQLTYRLADFLPQHAKHYSPPRFPARALVHGHCHQKSLNELDAKHLGQLHAERCLFDAMGILKDIPDSGCCGMAGAFGYERENGHYDVSLACGERVLLPKVRQASQEDLIVADGFSCREQIEQSTDRVALHTAHVLQLAIARRDRPDTNRGGRPEAGIVASRKRERRIGMIRTAAVLLLGSALTFTWLARWRRLR